MKISNRLLDFSNWTRSKTKNCLISIPNGIIARKFNLTLLIVLLGFISSSSSFAQQYINWNGYIQTRFSSNFNNSSEFTIRRAKLWVYGTVPNEDFISYKIQLNYRSFKDESLMLQDAFIDVRLKSYGSLRTGRFVPDFMLQRMQPDYEIPVLERADVINNLVHNEKQMARETGVQYTFQRNLLPAHFSLGIFNANIDKPTHSKDNSLLYTSRLTYKIINHKYAWLSIGGSAAYRHLDKTTLNTIYKADSLIFGDDFRWGVEAQLHLDNVDLQGEYVQANINKDKAKGWYVLADYTFWQKYQAVMFAQKYTAPNPEINSNVWYGLGFNCKITGKTKLMADFKTQKSATKQNYLGEIQLQFFLN